MYNVGMYKKGIGKLSAKGQNLIIEDVGITTRTLQVAEFRLHRHHHYEIICVLGGQVLHTVNGVKHIHSEGDCVVLGPNASHEVEPILKTAVLRHVMIAPKFFISTLQLIGEENLFSDSDICVVKFTKSEMIEIEAIIRQFSSESSYSRKRCIGAELILKVANKKLSKEKVIGTALPPIVRKICENLYKDEFVKGGIQLLLTDLKYSNSYVCHIFKRYMGITLSDYIKNIRVDHMAYYLKATDYSLKEICDFVGIDSLSYANKVFKEKYKMTPITYRKNNV